MFGSGLKLEADDNGGGTVTGPKVGDGTITATHFSELVISTGLKLQQEDCKFTLTSSGTTAKVGATGCGNNEDCFDHTGCLVFGSGLKLESDSNGGGTVTGPTVSQEDVAGPFTKLVVGTGLKLEEGDNCEYTISSNLIQVGSQGCGVTESCFDMTGCLTFSGFDFNKAENGGANVKAPMVSGKFFKNIQLGEGLEYKQLGACEYELSAISGNNSGIKVGSTGCYDVACARIGSDDCLVFEGLKFDGTNKVLGPYISDNEEGDGSIFGKILVGSGLKLEEKNDCVYEINAEAASGLNIAIDTCHNTNDQACTDPITIGGSDCLTIGGGLYFDTSSKTLSGPKLNNNNFSNLTIDVGNGLVVTSVGDCGYTLAWTGGMTEATGIKVGAQTACTGGPVGEATFIKGGLYFGGGLTMEGAEGDAEGRLVKQGTFNSKPWQNIEIGEGLELDGGTDTTDCQFTLKSTIKSGIKIQGRGCGGIVDCDVMSGCLIFDGGLKLEEDGINRVITAPTVNNEAYSNLKFEGNGVILHPPTEGNCEFRVEIPSGVGDGGSGITQLAKVGCGDGGQSCTPISGCLTFGAGLSLSDVTDTAATVTGPKFGGSAFSNVVAGSYIKIEPGCEATISVTGVCSEEKCEELQQCCTENSNNIGQLSGNIQATGERLQDKIAATGKKAKQCCDENTELIDNLDDKISDVSGLVPKFGSQSCGGAEDECDYSECVRFGAGLTYQEGVVKGPTIGGGSVNAGHFGNLIISDGLTLTAGGSAECTYTLKADGSSPEWFYIGCDGSANVNMGTPTAVKVGYGLSATHLADDVVQIEGPRIKDSAFSNLKPDSTDIVTLNSAGNCEWEIGIDCDRLKSECELGTSGVKVAQIDCGLTKTCDANATCLKFAGGIQVGDVSNGEVTITGPKFAGQGFRDISADDSTNILTVENTSCFGTIKLDEEKLKQLISGVVEDWCDENGCGEGGGSEAVGACSSVNKTINVVTNVCCTDSSFSLSFTELTFLNGCLSSVDGNPDPPSCP